MLLALTCDDALCAPTVGTFVPLVGSGTRILPGLRIGRLRRLGRWVDLLVPDGVIGHACPPLPAWSPVEYGTRLLRVEVRGQQVETAAQVERPQSQEQPVLAAVEGVLYRRPHAMSACFAPEGSRVRAQEVIALVEVMKVFVPVLAPVGGVLRRWLAADGGAIPAGTPIAFIEPEERPSPLTGVPS